MLTHERKVSEETAILAHEKGFKGPCVTSLESKTHGIIPLPTHGHLAQWLRDKYGTMVWVEPTYYDGWTFATHCCLSNGNYWVADSKESDSFETSFDQGLKEVLKFIIKF